MKVAVLLSTYNSARFLEEQIKSVLNQTFQDFTLYIRDDGSCDNTLAIISSLSAQDSRISLVDSCGINLKSAGSFVELMKTVEADFYFFCDHDDVWHEHKMEFSLSAMFLCRTFKSSAPILVATDLQVVDENLNPLAKSFREVSCLYPNELKKFENLSATNFVTGCTVLFNRVLRDIAITYPLNSIVMHDHWLALVALKNSGELVYLPVPTLCYRQHANNVVGVSRRRSIFNLAGISRSFDVLLSYYRQAKSVNPSITFRAVLLAKVIYRFKVLWREGK
ncbi:MAG: glycosyltransferase family 2 protein [Oceanospirillaceae bacterium]|nr:glycosyltransferase family 2 protein [Oceanospirillaceae bacterium]